ncbi:unnamed protein product [Paramecium octaurelia]|uniref:Papain family cysteine protease n=1 Tax=Paramecium octaurelia TaxID=43137 RepID=A0A8S1T985_PAROT|nr:unnamed protein product [Paramecium octaurelia]
MKNIIAATLTTFLIGLGYYQENLDSASDFERWALKHGKSYYGDEKIYRQTIYYQNKKTIDEHNKRTDVTYLMGENQFMTITNEEFIRLYLNTKSPEQQNNQNKVIRKNIHKSLETINKENKKWPIDWRGKVKVKNQGSCPSSYAMSATSQVEAEYAVLKETSLTLSAQQIMDCQTMFRGCDPNYDGNTAWDALSYIENNGLYPESSYPYTGRDQWCQVNTGGPWKIKNRWRTFSTTVQELQSDLYFYYPYLVVVDATKWQFYGSGIFSDCSSDVSQGKYYALVVGFEDIWFVQPSFGTAWGESGYIRLAPGNTCGILNFVYHVDFIKQQIHPISKQESIQQENLSNSVLIPFLNYL